MAAGTVDVKRHGGAAWIVSLHGEHDLTTRPILAGQLRGLAQTGDGLIVDMTHTEFIDSTVIGALARAHDSTSDRDRQFAVVAPVGSFARKLLDLVSLSEPMGTHDMLADAVASVSHDDLLREAAG